MSLNRFRPEEFIPVSKTLLWFGLILLRPSAFNPLNGGTQSGHGQQKRATFLHNPLFYLVVLEGVDPASEIPTDSVSVTRIASAA